MAADRTGSLAPGGQGHAAPRYARRSWPPETVTTPARLCAADRITPWYHEDDVCWVADCEICATPMVVWRWHGTEPSPTSTTCSGGSPCRRRRTVRRPLPRRQHAEHPRPLPHARAPRAASSSTASAIRRSGPAYQGRGPPPARSPGGAGPTRRLIPVGAYYPAQQARTAPVVCSTPSRGQPFFDELVERFYRGVEADAVLRPMWTPDRAEAPRPCSSDSTRRPETAYSDERGHPPAHAPRFFVIGDAEATPGCDTCAALDSLVDERDVHPAIEARMLDYFGMAADGMINAC